MSESKLKSIEAMEKLYNAGELLYRGEFFEVADKNISEAKSIIKDLIKEGVINAEKGSKVLEKIDAISRLEFVPDKVNKIADVFEEISSLSKEEFLNRLKKAIGE
jgi:polyhydroxyalkanoate synthesis regulator phasin